MSDKTFSIQWTCYAAPLQAEGFIDGRPWYFRARWEAWWFGIADKGGNAVKVSLDEEKGFRRCGRWGDGEFAASYMPPIEGLQIIWSLIGQWRQAR